MLNHSASLAMSTSVLKALPGKLDIKRHSPSILYLISSSILSASLFKSLFGSSVIGPDLGPNCLQRLSADNTRR